MVRVREVELTLYTAKHLDPNNHNRDIKHIFNQLRENYKGKISFDKSTTVAEPKIKLQYKEVRTKEGLFGEKEVSQQKTIDFDAPTTFESIDSTIQAKTNTYPVKQSKSATTNTNNGTKSDNNTVEDIKNKEENTKVEQNIHMEDFVMNRSQVTTTGISEQSCSQCGKSVSDDDAEFCPYCGQKL